MQTRTLRVMMQDNSVGRIIFIAPERWRNNIRKNPSFGACAGSPDFEGILEYCDQDFAAFRQTRVSVLRSSSIPPASPKGVRGEDLGCKIEILFD
ncbi:hypothetical protein DPMN_139925 [Dreissena polymorpha]|uniref:Uncharacterized protein n=1 Tax=Dreissena polymorpha TaxID=45954 RepID=A0A9D4GAH7_DREPO|nr:hypothetical protein DPMN_139925 [Dreissena polymorpha]